MTLRENNLKEIEGGHILDSQGILVGSRRALQERSGLLEVRFRGGARLRCSAATDPDLSGSVYPF